MPWSVTLPAPPDRNRPPGATQMGDITPGTTCRVRPPTCEIMRATVGGGVVDKFTDPVLTPKEVARHLGIPESTVYYWLREEANGVPLVHRVEPERRGWPSVPFIAVVEAYVLRALRDLGLTKAKIRDAAAEVRRAFNTPYALATQKIATDGVDIFVHYADDDLARAADGQRPFRVMIDDYLDYIEWDAKDKYAGSLRLRQYPDVAPVI